MKISLAHFDRFRAFAADTISYMAMRQARRQSVAGYSCIVKPCPAHGDKNTRRIPIEFALQKH